MQKEDKVTIQKMPTPDEVINALSEVKSMDDFFGKKGLLAKLFAKSIENMLAAELTASLGYQKNQNRSGKTTNNRNGYYDKKIRGSLGDVTIEIPRDRDGVFEPQIIKKRQKTTNELEDKIIAMYGRGMSVRDINANLGDLYGIEISDPMISMITDKILPLITEWQNRPLEAVYVMAWLDCIHVKIRLDGKVENRAVYNILGLNLEGQKEVLGMWISKDSEGANHWLSVLNELQNRGVKDILICCVDGLKSFNEAIRAVYPETLIQRCIIHEIRNSLKYVNWKDRKEFVADLKLIYRAATEKAGYEQLQALTEKWSDKYTMACKIWERDWAELSTFFDFSPELKKIMYTTNMVEGYHRQLRKFTKTKSLFPTEQAALKSLFLAMKNATNKWSMPIHNWGTILNQLIIKFPNRINMGITFTQNI